MVAAPDLQERYEAEKAKRINEKGLSQYLEKTDPAIYALIVDPWVEDGTPVREPVPNGGHCKIVIYGSGFGGITAAVRCLQSGAAASPEDILIVDPAGGFGGTWWWNRFPGLMCDIESYIYLPCLEETGYMPKDKYAGGKEIREYADILADQFKLRERAMFQTSGQSLTWENNQWICGLVEKPKGLPEKEVTITADYVILASGTFTYPKLPNCPGIKSFKGQMLHTARWNYGITGGSQDNPECTGLEGKRVAFVGTGATAVQAVPQVAKYAKELYVFQRTPSAVDYRGNRSTDPEEWKNKIATKPGWQLERMENFQAFTENVVETPKVDLVDDGWTKMPSISGAWGGNGTVTEEGVAKFVEEMQALDAERSDRIRQRVADTVHDKETVKNLQAWYPGWCKRPCMHDEYLPAFNRPGVHLVDTAGKGIADVTANGIIANDIEYPIDIIIWGTGYGSPLTDSLAGKAGMTVLGRNSLDMDTLFKSGELTTLHGIIGHNFPNLFSLGLSQAGVGVNQSQRLDAMSIHTAYMIAAAEKQAAASGKKVVIEPTKDACTGWGDKVAGYAYLLANMAGCLPSYFNMEGDAGRVSEADQAKAMRNTLWGQGFSKYNEVLRDWEKKGDLEGLVVQAA